MTGRRLSAWLPVLAWAAVIFAFSSIPNLGTGLGVWDTILRKGAHTLEYAILGALLLRAIRREAPAFLAGVGYAVTDEIHQPLRRRPPLVAGRRRDRLLRRPARRARLSVRRPPRSYNACVPDRKQLDDRQLDVLLERLDNLVDEIRVLNKRLDHAEGFARVAHEIRNLNESLQTLAYAALGQQGPQVRRRRAG